MLCLCVQRYSAVRHRARHGRTRRAGSWRRIGGTIVTFHVVVLAWVLFRADSFQAAWAFLTGIASWRPATSISPIGWTSTRLLLLIGTLLAVDALAERTGAEHSCLRWHWAAQGLAYGGLAVLTILLGNIRGDVPFVYFQF